jgi:hypothetical protein
MTFSEYSIKSVSKPRILVQIDILKVNTQWINTGAGIWYVNFDNLYPEVDSTLLDGFTVQTFGGIGSVMIDTAFQTKVSTLAELTSDPGTYYFDEANKEVYICINSYDEPSLHDILLGVIHGYSYDDFTPVDSYFHYQGRLSGSPEISVSRDPLFFGKLQYNFGSFQLVNADGEFDTFAIDNNVYGNEARVYFGYEDLSVNDYIKLYSGVIEKISIAEDYATFSIGDKRKQLSKSITYTCSALNALDAIVEVLNTNYGTVYSDNYFNTIEWDIAKALVPNVTINIAPGKDMDDIPTNDFIELICKSVFGLFLVNTDNKYTFKIVNTTASASSTIYAIDILNHHEIEYDPTEVISSTKIGYNKNWNEGYQSPYTWLYDTSQENTIFLKYKTYNQKEFMTALIDTSAQTVIQAFSDIILNYTKDVHGIGSVEVPMKYYTIELTNIVNIEINRETTTMLGTKRCEIISKKYNLSGLPTITFGYRII